MDDALHLEPMGIGRILDRTFQLYRGNLATFLTVAAVVQTPLFLATLPFLKALTATVIPMQEELAKAPDADVLAQYFLALGKFWSISFALSIVAYQLANGALVKCVSDAYLGLEPGVGRAFRVVLPLLPVLIVAALVVLILVFVGFLFCVVPGVIATYMFCVVSQVIVVERAGPLSAVKRSWRLVSGNLGRAFCLSLVVLAISFAVGLLTGAIGQAFRFALGTDSAAYWIVLQLLGLASRVVTLPIGSAALCLFYYDLRIRKEGFDLEMLARSMRSEAPPADEL
jgi:hypothetical protein